MRNQGKITINQPGDEVEEVLNPGLAEEMPKEGAIAMLWSSWGLEGLYDNTRSLSEAITGIRKLAAYRDERITVEIRKLNGPI